ncbi:MULTISPECIES: type II toxin-antitoxin system PemK/MazF family toxin [Vibrio]|jgi:mRNA interferase ChpB|uniref:type II toxin-antitoxin system PemK/MazF family toxin n=1 Tax=Vibrio TaxID=662 RepID=UPI000E6777DF|nr:MULTISPECIES: type II toxin-antitoxin system PemK/MazF family toxin [Vibrio]EKO3892289.1 type II toxin-antitoxin system PemK/MazF family toxin [Vibrio metschnikovii]MCG3731593.1 type II toxin-antitoxin system PemK/MazF family toxin [Vibrio cincinnatiensis]
MSKYSFHQSSIVHLEFDPSTGREMKGKHFALVISNDEFNESEMAMVCPITQGIYHREGGFTTTLMGTGTKTNGIIVANQAQILDLKQRKAKFIEYVDSNVLDEVLAKVKAILD